MRREGAGGEESTSEPKAYRWQDEAREEDLTPGQIERLAADKLIILSKRTHPQVGAGYYWSHIPVFVTSDSMLAAYHRLYEDSVMAMEHRRAGQLGPVLDTLWQGLDAPVLYFGEPDELFDRGQHRARFVIGVAMRLLNDEPLKPAVDGKLAAEIDATVRHIAQPDGEAAAPPAWVNGLVDYDRLNPRGFYTRSELLQRYFRAVAWLQEVPFFIDDDDSLAAFVMLMRVAADSDKTDGGQLDGDDGQPDGTKPKSLRAFMEEFLPFVGGKDDWDLMTFVGESIGPLDAESLQEARMRLEVRWEDESPYEASLVGDAETAVVPEGEDEGEDVGTESVPRPHFVVISALRTPDAVMFTETADIARFRHRMFPNGLEIPAAMGSAEALTLLSATKGVHDDVIELVRDRFVVKDADAFDNADEEEEEEEPGPGRLYADYLYCLQSLLDAPEPEAPPLFGTTPWKRKSIQTVCGGWAQLRHTWTLQAKESGGLFAGNSPPSGFVEPDPEFFARLADLAERSQRMLDRRGDLDTERAELAAAARSVADLIERADFGERGAAALAALSPSEAEQLRDVLERARSYRPDGKPMRADYEPETDDDVVARSLPGLVPQLRKIAADIDKGEGESFGLAGLFRPSATPLHQRWQLLALVARRLETLAHKQLRGVELSAADARFMRKYSDSLSEAMGYPSADFMPDDAPWVASVYHRALRGNLQVATGRPTEMYILYPHKGREVLCRGVVVPYHEFSSPTRLTDDAWREMLDTGTAAPVPGWAQGLYNDEKPPEDHSPFKP